MTTGLHRIYRAYGRGEWHLRVRVKLDDMLLNVTKTDEKVTHRNMKYWMVFLAANLFVYRAFSSIRKINRVRCHGLHAGMNFLFFFFIYSSFFALFSLRQAIQLHVHAISPILLLNYVSADFRSMKKVYLASTTDSFQIGQNSLRWILLVQSTYTKNKRYCPRPSTSLANHCSTRHGFGKWRSGPGTGLQLHHFMRTFCAYITKHNFIT